MQPLSIIVPLLGHSPSFEETLISVLENRPRGAEVIVACDRTYADPYALEGEVRFVRVDRPARWTDYANAAARDCRGAIIHWLWPGAHVADCWCDAAVDALQFDDELASVAPIVVADSARWAGVSYAPPGRRILQRCDRCRLTGDQRLQLDGPSLLAGWYRRASLFAVGGWDSFVGMAMADVDLALRLNARGSRCHLAVTSEIEFPNAMEQLPAHRGFDYARSAERMVRRHAQRLGWKRGPFELPHNLMLDAFSAPPLIGALTQWSGRLSAHLGGEQTVAPWCDEDAPVDPSESPAALPQGVGRWEGDEYLRHDGAHTHAPARKHRAARREMECG